MIAIHKSDANNKQINHKTMRGGINKLKGTHVPMTTFSQCHGTMCRVRTQKMDGRPIEENKPTTIESNRVGGMGTDSGSETFE